MKQFLLTCVCENLLVLKSEKLEVIQEPKTSVAGSAALCLSIPFDPYGSQQWSCDLRINATPEGTRCPL